MSALTQMIGLAGPPLGSQFKSPATGFGELDDLLREKNGFFAFESALHVFPTGSSAVMSLEEWNAESLWRHEYGDLADGLLFFAEDIFGVQFAYDGHAIWSFDPETGSREHFSPTLDAWADSVLADYKVTTGYELAHEWQLEHGPLPLDHRLVPKQLFITGGTYSVDNLYSVTASQGMGFRGSIAAQIRDLPEGAQISIVAK